MMNTPDDLNRMRHTASHVMSFAVKMLRPDVKMGVGPWTETGFYQDYDFGDDAMSASDLKKIEKKMRWIMNKNFAVVRREVPAAEATERFGHDPYKMELITDLVEKGETLSFYDFVDDDGNIKYTDLCAGPHVASTGDIGVFKLMKVAGAYWRGDADKAQLTRLYGVTFEDKDGLDAYLHMLEEAEKRDHRKLGKQLDLFTFSPLVGPGLPLFTPKGTFLRDTIQGEIMRIQKAYGYERVNIPHITKKDLYEKSGHWGKYKDDLFHVHGKQDTQFVMKPMNCPHHTQIFASRMRSYRDLPQRYCEVTTCYRDEQPGELLGLSRVRSLTQDDGHVFCRLSQVKEEARTIVKIIRKFYQKMGMWEDGSFWVSLSVRDPKTPEKYLGDTSNWDTAEAMLQEVSDEENLNCTRVEGEAAFYGPKLDFQFKDAIGRQWQLATIQLDFVMPERFELEYVNEKGERERPVMVHRAVAGSLERFLSVIIEHFAGAFPLWLSPIQAHIIPVGTEQHDAAYALAAQLKAAGGRVEVYESNESLGKRVRNAQTAKVPYSIILGGKEVENGTATLRAYGEKKDTNMTIDAVVELLKA